TRCSTACSSSTPGAAPADAARPARPPAPPSPGPPRLPRAPTARPVAPPCPRARPRPRALARGGLPGPARPRSFALTVWTREDTHVPYRLAQRARAQGPAPDDRARRDARRGLRVGDPGLHQHHFRRPAEAARQGL